MPFVTPILNYEKLIKNAMITWIIIFRFSLYCIFNIKLASKCINFRI